MDTYIITGKWYGGTWCESIGEFEERAHSEQKAREKALQTSNMQVLSCKKKNFVPQMIDYAATSIKYNMNLYEKDHRSVHREHALASIGELRELLNRAEQQLRSKMA